MGRATVRPRAERRPQIAAHSAQAVEALVEKALQARPNAKAPTVLYKALKKKTGANSISFELKRGKGAKPSTDFEIYQLSHHLRAKCKIGMLVVDSADEATSVSDAEAQEDIRRLAREQGTAAGKFPGPVPIVWRKDFATVQQIAEARALGCHSVTLRAEKLQGEKLAHLVNVCHALGMEPLVEVSDKEQIASAVAAGARCLCVRFNSGAVSSFLVWASKTLSSELRNVSGDVAAVGSVQARQGGAELEQARTLMQAEGFHGVLFPEAIVDAGDDQNAAYLALLSQALSSKRSKTLVVNEKQATGGGYDRSLVRGWGNEGTHV